MEEASSHDFSLLLFSVNSLELFFELFLSFSVGIFEFFCGLSSAFG
jgi:hypothetical protein